LAPNRFGELDCGDFTLSARHPGQFSFSGLEFGDLYVQIRQTNGGGSLLFQSGLEHRESFERRLEGSSVLSGNLLEKCCSIVELVYHHWVKGV
jgi:hypothetical protein